MRSVLILLIVTVGCVATLPRDDASITADLACEAARAILQSRTAPTPEPGPKPGSKCTNCDGTGYVYVGDGTVREKVRCFPCEGTGKVK